MNSATPSSRFLPRSEASKPQSPWLVRAVMQATEAASHPGAVQRTLLILGHEGTHLGIEELLALRFIDARVPLLVAILAIERLVGAPVIEFKL